MEIDWFGLSCFRLRGREATLVTDPYDKTIGLSFPRPRADIVTISHDHPGHNYAGGVKGDPKVLRGPGEYEVKNVFVTGVQSYHDRRSGRDRGKNTIFVIELEGLRFCHAGDIGFVPNQNQAESYENVDVLFVPVGGGNALNASEATELVSLLEPRLVIPMHYKLPELTLKLDAVDKFVKEMGVKAPPTVESFKLTRDSLPKETQLLLFEPKQKEA